MSEIEAAKAIEVFFKAFNTYDEEEYKNSQHFPHIRINDLGSVSIVMNASELLPLATVLAYMKKKKRDGTTALWTRWRLSTFHQ